jgi:hypothetical protein
MKPGDVKRIVDRLNKLGFKVELKAGGVDRANRPLSIELQATRQFTNVEDRRAFAELVGLRPLA